MGDQQHRSIARRVEGVLDQPLGGLGVEVGGRLVEQQDGGGGEQRPGDDQALPLPAGEFLALLADERAQAGRQRADPVAEPGGVERRPQCRPRRRRASDPQVGLDRGAEQVSVLAGEREAGPQVVLAQRPGVGAPDLDRCRRPDRGSGAAGRRSCSCRSRSGPSRATRSPGADRQVETGERRHVRSRVDGRHVVEADGRIRRGVDGSTGSVIAGSVSVSSSTRRPDSTVAPELPRRLRERSPSPRTTRG